MAAKRPIRRRKRGIVRSAALRRSALSLLNGISIGFRSGEYLGPVSSVKSTGPNRPLGLQALDDMRVMLNLTADIDRRTIEHSFAGCPACRIALRRDLGRADGLGSRRKNDDFAFELFQGHLGLAAGSALGDF